MQEGLNILVTNSPSEAYMEHNIVGLNATCEGTPTIIDLISLIPTRKEQLKYFHNYISEQHWKFISEDY